VQTENIEDISERFLPLFTDNQDSDTVKRINLNDGEMFIINILEHESGVNFDSSFKMLQYVMYVLDDFKKENDRKYKEELDKYGSTKRKLSKSKSFKYPPVFPIVFYDGATKWTSERNFYDRTDMNRIFSRYIPDFEYELVDLNVYSQHDLVAFNNALSLILIVDKVRKADDIKKLGELPNEYVEEMTKKIPKHFLKIFSDCIRLLLERANAPREEIEIITEKIHERRLNNMFEFIDGYDIQATRKQIRAEEKQEAMKEAKKEAMEEYANKEKEYAKKIKLLEEKLKKYENI
jgi:hypothetical protein